MSKLKPKQIKNSSQTESLPSLMSSMETTMDLYPIALQKLQPAPQEWNFYHALAPGKRMELLESIAEHGLFHPVVVWEKRAEEFVILSGHNRVEAYRMLWETTGDVCYQTIPCVVKRGISEWTAREIIVDSNWVQRNLSIGERTKSIYTKYVILGRQKRSPNGKTGQRTYDLIAQMYGLSSRQIARYVQLNRLIAPLLQRVDQGTLSFRSGILLSSFSEEMQTRIVSELGDRLSNASVATLRKDMQYEEVYEALTHTAESHTVTLTLKVPEEFKQEFLQMAQQWIAERKG